MVGVRTVAELGKTLGVLAGLWAILGVVGWAAGAFPQGSGSPRGSDEPLDAGLAQDAGVDGGHDTSDAAPEPIDAAVEPAAPTAESTPRIALCAAPGDVVWELGDLVGSADEEIVVACESTIQLLAWGVTEEVPVLIARVSLRPGTHVRDLAIGDVDADQRPDLVVSLDDGLYLLPRDASGGFAPPRTLAPGQNGALVLAPFDADPGLDLAVVHGAEPRPELWIYRGGPSPVRASTFPAPVATSALAALDLDVDGHLDVVAIGSEQILLAFGDSRASAARSRSLTPGGRGGVALVDVDAVGALDLVIEAEGGPCVLSPGPEMAEDALCTTLAALDADVRSLRAAAAGIIGIHHPEIVRWTAAGSSVAATVATESFGAHRAALVAGAVVVLGSLRLEDGARELQILRAPTGTRIGDGERREVNAAPLVLELTLPDPDAP